MRYQLSQSLAPSPKPFRFVDLDRQTNRELRQEIHRRTKCLRLSPACRKTSQKRVAQNDNAQQPSNRSGRLFQHSLVIPFDFLEERLGAFDLVEELSCLVSNGNCVTLVGIVWLAASLAAPQISLAGQN